MFIHVTFENAEWFASERIEIFSASRRIDENSNPVIPRFIRRIGVADQQARFLRQSVGAEDPLKYAAAGVVPANESIDFCRIHQLVKSNTIFLFRSISSKFSNSAYAMTVTVCANALPNFKSSRTVPCRVRLT